MTSTASTTSVASMTSTASFYQKTFNLQKNICFWWFVTFYYLKKAPKSQNNSTFIKEQEVLINWTIEGARNNKEIKTDEFSIKLPFSYTQDPKYQQKSKSIYSPGENCFALFALRYIVHKFWNLKQSPTYLLSKCLIKWNIYCLW